jgi:tetratricopeptide (TPR) repeat protein
VRPGIVLALLLGAAAASAAAPPSDAELAQLASAAEAHPDDPALARALARARLERGDVEPAIAGLREFGARLPQHRASLSLLLGRALYTRGELAEARAELEQAIAHRPDDALAHFYLGLVLLKSGDADGAARELRSAEQRQPGLLPSHRPREATPRPRGRLSFTGGTGVELDTNPTIEGEESPSATEGGDDFRLVYHAALSTQLLRTERSALSASYRFDESRHDDHDELDLQSHALGLGAVHAFPEGLFVRLDGGAGMSRLDHAGYLDTLSLAPTLGRQLGSRGVLRLRGVAERREFADEPSQPSLERDGWRYAAALQHTLPLPAWSDARLTTQLQYARTLTGARTDADGFGPAFDSHWFSADAALSVALGLGIRMETRLLVAYERFDEENAVQYAADYHPTANPDPRRVRRRDTVIDTSLSFVRPLTRLVDLELRLRDTQHGSSAEVYDWDRQIVGTYLRVRFDR